MSKAKSTASGTWAPAGAEVYVVTWEYPPWENGEVFGVVGVAATIDGARHLAEDEAEEYLACHEGDGKIVAIDGKKYEPGAKSDGEVPLDWDLWIAWEQHEVNP
jgi:hypothetical protein